MSRNRRYVLWLVFFVALAAFIWLANALTLGGSR